MTRHPIAQIAPNGNPKSQETSALLPFSREIDYFSRRVSLGASTLTRFFTDDALAAWPWRVRLEDAIPARCSLLIEHRWGQRSTGRDRHDLRACGSPYQPPAAGASPRRRCHATETDWAGACCGGREKVVAGLYPRSRRTVPVTIVSTSRLPHKRRSVASSGRVTFLCVCIENRLAFL